MSQYNNSGWDAQSSQTGYSDEQYGYAGEYSQTGQPSYYYSGDASQTAGYSAADYQYPASNDIENSSMYDYTGSSPENDIDDQARELERKQYEKDSLEDKNRKRTDDFVKKQTKSHDKLYEHDSVAAKKRQMARFIQEQTGEKPQKKSSKDTGHKKSNKNSGRKGK